MLRLLADENFNGDIVRALLLRQPELDIVRVQDVGLAGVDDPGILDWAAANDRIILTHDRATLPDYAYERLAAGERTSGTRLPRLFRTSNQFKVLCYAFDHGARRTNRENQATSSRSSR